MRVFRNMSIHRRLLWLPLLAIGAALLLAVTGFVAFEWYVLRDDPGALHNRMPGLLTIAALALLFSVGIAVLLATGLRRTIQRPILHMLQTVRHVSDQRDYAIRAMSGSDDELGLLASSLNEMLDRIQARDRALEQHRDVQDDEIQRRTQALESAVDDLRDEIHQREHAEARVRELAYYDPVTALPNRKLLLERLEGALAASRDSGRPVALLFLDLDRFKETNDSLGHQAGDDLLEQIAGRLVQCVRGMDHVSRVEGEEPPSTVSRQGGDEFTVLLTRLHSSHDATRVCKRILDALTEPFSLGPREVVIGASIGIAVFPDDGADAETLIEHADTAMYQAKTDGGNDYQYFSESMKAAAIERLHLEGDLRRALLDQQLHLEYQPIFRIGDGRLAAVEALLRWRHPTRGNVPPDVFVAVAEECGLVVPIGEWALREAVHQCQRWRRDYRDLAELEVGVNVSFRQFRKGRLLQAATRALNESGLPASALMLEMTETTMLQGEQETLETLLHLKDLGVRVALDDFGTGFSSLSHLRRLPLDSLKIDRSFISNLDEDSESERIVTAVIAMGHGLGLRVVAEGIEREQQLELLGERGCDFAQGYLLSPPVAPEAVPGIARSAKIRAS
jgi:predicted signal transduction protein with EAL and GGDEF domain